MPEQTPHNLEGVPETLLLTLYARARESQRPDAMIRDERAAALVKRIVGDFPRYRMHRHDEIAIIMRLKKFDSHACDFLKRNPSGIIVHIGCGLDTRFERVDNGGVEWFDLDMPEVIELRRRLIRDAGGRYHLLAGSVFESAWLEEVSSFKPRAFMFIAEGVLPYFEEAQVKSLCLRLREHFPGSELVTDAHTPFVLWADNLQLAQARLKARLQWGLKDARDPEGWADGICLLDEWNYYEDDEPRLKAFRWARRVPFIAKSSGIYHYRLG